jgi:hypothetical protein
MLSLSTSLPVWFRIFSGWVHRSLQDVIAFLVEENRLLKQRLGDRRLHFTPSERHRLAKTAGWVASLLLPRGGL